MHTFLEFFQQSGKYSAQLASHEAELRREGKYPDQKCLKLSSSQTEYLNLDRSQSGSSKCSHDLQPRQAKGPCPRPWREIGAAQDHHSMPI